ncbi:MAG TPA: glycosyltransferase family 9 protein [Gemmatimonadaceae bacterium]|nr:glycosyltransferase family 9 protein [Gemmatimonadaceae bacterium]
MAQTWPVSRARIAALKAADVAGRILFAPFRVLRRASEPARAIQRILVIEPWYIGDVVLVAPFLSALRDRFTGASISLLARPYARQLLANTGLIDEVIDAELPWTAPSHKYRFDAAARRHMRDLIATLRERKFDLTIDARMDVRSNLLAAITLAPRRIGYDIGGGGWLLTESLPSNRDDTHKHADWDDLLALLPGEGRVARRAPARPLLVVTRDEKDDAERLLTRELGTARPTIGYHPGGSHPGKRWPGDHFRELSRMLRDEFGGRHVVMLGPDDEDPGDWPESTLVVRPGLRELMAIISCCDVFICNDSGPMHIADALRTPLVAIFEMGNPKWFGPTSPSSVVVAGEMAGLGVSPAPVDTPPSNPVTVTCVADAVRHTLQTQL